MITQFKEALNAHRKTSEGEEVNGKRPANVFPLGRTRDGDTTSNVQFTGTIQNSSQQDIGTALKLPIKGSTVEQLRYPDAKAAAEERAKEIGDSGSHR